MGQLTCKRQGRGVNLEDAGAFFPKLGALRLACRRGFDMPTTADKSRLPLGIQTFEKIRKENFIYVDKTAVIHQLLTGGQQYFLARPRRFGKSVLLSTLRALFQGRRELFEGLWIAQHSNWDWPQHPVIHLDVSRVSSKTPDSLEADLKDLLVDIAREFQVSLNMSQSLAICFGRLIKQVSQHNQVVVLVDEYDKPIVGHLELGPDRLAIAKGNQEVLKNFYGILKSHEKHLQFLLLTGVTKFSKTSIFSELNHLVDLTLKEDYATLLGYTREELTEYFGGYLQRLANKEGVLQQALMEKIRHWYNGYRFSARDAHVYNPVSTLNLFAEEKFKPYWFETGSPSLLVNAVKNQQDRTSLLELVGTQISESDFSSCDIDMLELAPLFVQTGYLTIADYWRDEELGKTQAWETQYRLDYPNWEVRHAFINHLIKRYTGLNVSRQHQLTRGIRACLQQGDVRGYVDRMQAALASVPGQQKHLARYENHYQNLFYAFTMQLFATRAEESSVFGRSDMVIEAPHHTYILEFKVKPHKWGRGHLGEDQARQLADVALGQIEAQKYHGKYLHQGKQLVLVGVGCSNGLIAAWSCKTLDKAGNVLHEEAGVPHVK